MAQIGFQKVDSTTPANIGRLTPASEDRAYVFLKDNGTLPPTLHVAKNVGSVYTEAPLETTNIIYGNYGVASSWNITTNTYTLSGVSNFPIPPTSLTPAQAGLMLTVKFSKSPNSVYTGDQNLKITWGTNTFNVAYDGTDKHVYDVENEQVVLLVWDGTKFQQIEAKPVTVINSNYAEVKSLRDNGDLIAGAMYRIADYETTYKDETSTPVTDGGVFFSSQFEPLLVQAVASNKLSSYALSEEFPEDVIEYSIDPASWAPSATGEILYRKDPNNNVETWFDFRGVLFPRWNIDGNTATNIDDFTYSSSPVGRITPNDFIPIGLNSGNNIPGGDAGTEIGFTATSSSVTYHPCFPLNSDKSFTGTVRNVSLEPANFSNYTPSGYVDSYNNTVFYNSSVVQNVSGAIGGCTFIGLGAQQLEVVSILVGCLFMDIVNEFTVTKRVQDCVFTGATTGVNIDTQLTSCVFDTLYNFNLSGGQLSSQRFINFDNNSAISGTYLFAQRSTFTQKYALNLTGVNLGLIQDSELFVRDDMQWVGEWIVYSNNPDAVAGKRIINKITGSSPQHNIRIKSASGIGNVPLRFDSLTNIVAAADDSLYQTQSTITLQPNDYDFIEFSKPSHQSPLIGSNNYWTEESFRQYIGTTTTPPPPVSPAVGFNVSPFNTDFTINVGSNTAVSFLLDRLGCTDSVTVNLISSFTGITFNGGSPLTIAGSISLVSGLLAVGGSATPGNYTLTFEFDGCGITRTVNVNIIVAP